MKNLIKKHTNWSCSFWIFIFFLLFTTLITSGQTIQTSTFGAGDSLGTVIRLTQNEIPAAIYVSDTLGTEPATISFYVLVGDTASKASTDSLILADWSLLTDVSDTTAYSLPIKRKLFIPLKATVFYSLHSDLYSYTSSKNGVIYIVPKISGGTSAAASLVFRMRRY